MSDTLALSYFKNSSEFDPAQEREVAALAEQLDAALYQIVFAPGSRSCGCSVEPACSCAVLAAA